MLGKRNIFLVGPMGAGKSTIGRQLARNLNLDFFDSDQEIEFRTGANISWVFDVEGEIGFRDREEKIINELTRKQGIVLATGGGSVKSSVSRNFLATRGLVIYLKTTIDKQLVRTKRDKRRPLLKSALVSKEGDLRQLLESLAAERDPLYEEIADITVSTDEYNARIVCLKVVMNDYEKILVTLNDRSYPIVIASGLLKSFSSFWPLRKGDVVVLITNNRIAPIYLNMVRSLLDEFGVFTDQLILPDGEQNKSLNVLNRIFTKLLNKNCDRNTVLMALGGGVIGDLTGFAAAVYLRGIRFIQVPTTLLAQVDASIGGKTGINHKLGKNMIGSFHQPISVVIDLDCLYTLDAKEFSSGLAEVIKYAVALDAFFFNWLEDNLDSVLKLNPESLTYCIGRCCRLKVSIITQDEREEGMRSLLNLGHTYAHAIESYLEYSTWSHGEAVSAGIMFAVRTAVYFKKFNRISDAKRIQLLLERAGLPIFGPEEMKAQDYIGYMVRDKKSRFGQINLVLPTSIGSAKVFSNVPQNSISNVIESSVCRTDVI